MNSAASAISAARCTSVHVRLVLAERDVRARSYRRTGTASCSTNADRGAQLAPVELAHVDLVVEHAPSVGTSEAGEAAHERGLARARAADEREASCRARASSVTSRESGGRVRRDSGSATLRAARCARRARAPSRSGVAVPPCSGSASSTSCSRCEQHRGLLQLVPQAEQRRDRRIGQQHERVERPRARRSSACRSATSSAPTQRNRTKSRKPATWTAAS